MNRRWPVLIAICGIVAAGRIALTQRLSGPPTGPSVAWTLPAPMAPDQLVGNDRCRACHRAEFIQYNKTSHARLESGASKVMSCESCHGPGKAHVEGQEAARGDEARTLAANKLIFAFRANVRENSERCLACHKSSKQQDSFLHSSHLATAVSCGDCHSSHLVNAVKDASKGNTPSPQAHFFQVPERADETRWLSSSLLKTAQPNLCYSCHATVRTQFAQPVHHLDHAPHVAPARLSQAGFEGLCP